MRIIFRSNTRKNAVKQTMTCSRCGGGGEEDAMWNYYDGKWMVRVHWIIAMSEIKKKHHTKLKSLSDNTIFTQFAVELNAIFQLRLHLDSTTADDDPFRRQRTKAQQRWTWPEHSSSGQTIVSPAGSANDRKRVQTLSFSYTQQFTQHSISLMHSPQRSISVSISIFQARTSPLIKFVPICTRDMR